MSRPGRRRPALVAATLSAVLGATLLAGCSAGAVTQTDTTVSGITGTEAQVGGVVLRALTVDGGTAAITPAGGTVALRGTIVNEALETDRLVSVSTPLASAVVPEGPTTIPGNTALRLVGAIPGPVGPSTPGSPVASTARISLAGVTQPVQAGPTFPVTLTFERAGTITVTVPVITGGPAAG